jgi:hypothetical protein
MVQIKLGLAYTFKVQTHNTKCYQIPFSNFVDVTWAQKYEITINAIPRHLTGVTPYKHLQCCCSNIYQRLLSQKRVQWSQFC